MRFFNNFGTFLAFIGVMFAPLCGIQIADYFFLRRQSISIRALYDPGSEAPYYFWRGFNPAAFFGDGDWFWGVCVFVRSGGVYFARAVSVFNGVAADLFGGWALVCVVYAVGE